MAEKFKQFQEDNLKDIIEEYNSFLDEYFTNNVLYILLSNNIFYIYDL